MISVIMSVYKEPIDWLRMSIDSVLNQTFRDFEFIIVCDNPNNADAIKNLKNYERKDSRIKLIFNEVNMGLTKSLNRALTQATGKYIARMDADDVSAKDRFLKQFNYMESNSNVIVLGTDVHYIGNKAWMTSSDAITFGNKNIKAQMLSGNCIAHSSVFIRKSVLDTNDIKYDENFRQSQDYRMWELLAPYGDYENFPEKLLYYRLSSQQISKSKSKGQLSLAKGVRFRWQKKWLDKNSVIYNDSDLENAPVVVLGKLRKRKELNRQPEFKAFVQYVYLNSGRNFNVIDCIKNGDVEFLTFRNILRLTVKLFA